MKKIINNIDIMNIMYKTSFILSIIFLVITDLLILFTFFIYNSDILYIILLSFIIMVIFSLFFIFSGIKIANYQKN